MEIVSGHISDLVVGDFFIPTEQVIEEELREHLMDYPLVMGYFFTGASWGELEEDDDILIIRVPGCRCG